jgi:hypothetical protein
LYKREKISTSSKQSEAIMGDTGRNSIIELTSDSSWCMDEAIGVDGCKFTELLDGVIEGDEVDDPLSEHDDAGNPYHFLSIK